MNTVSQMYREVLDDLAGYSCVQFAWTVVTSDPGKILEFRPRWCTSSNRGRRLAFSNGTVFSVDHVCAHKRHEVVVGMLGTKSFDGFIEPRWRRRLHNLSVIGYMIGQLCGSYSALVRRWPTINVNSAA